MFYENFIKICHQKGYIPTNVIEEIGLSSGNMSKWKNGATPNSKTVKKMADYLGVSSDRLIGSTHSSSIEMESDLQEIIDIYENLNMEGRKQLILQAKNLFKIDDYKKESKIKYAYRVAHTKEGKEPLSGQIIEISDEVLEKLRNAPESDIE